MRKFIKRAGSLAALAVLVGLGIFIEPSATSALSAQRVIGLVGFVVAAVLAVCVINYNYREVSQPHRF